MTDIERLLARSQTREGRGEYEDAIADLERALAGARDLPDPQAGRRLLIAALLALGNVHRTLADYEIGERYRREALALADAHLEPTDPQTAGALNALAVLFKYSGRFDEAEPLLTRALSILIDQDDPAAATILHNLGGLHHARRDFATAEPFARRAVELRLRTHADDDLIVAADRAALAPIVDALGHHAEAEALLLNALCAFEHAHGPEHYEVAVTLNNLAAIAQRTGDLQTAEARYRRALAIKERLFGADHPDVAVTLNNLGTILLAHRRDTEARDLLGRALQIFERTLAPDHPTLVVCRENRAACSGAAHPEPRKESHEPTTARLTHTSDHL
jgi:tetratricopeptide (TPR) repeat protein